MKAPPGLTYVTGPMGAGKTYFGVRKITQAIFSGKYVITNIRLLPGWAQRMARHTPQVWFAPWTYRKRVRYYTALYIFEEDLTQVIRYRVPRDHRKEGRVLMVWDEAHNDLNHRNWQERQKANAAKDGGDVMLRWATQMRKLGFVGYLLSQSAENTDAVLRRICTYEVRLRDQKELVRIMGLKLPFHFFLALWVPANVRKLKYDRSINHVERYFLTWPKRLYDTLDLYSGIDDDLDAIGAIVLPKNPLERMPPNVIKLPERTPQIESPPKGTPEEIARELFGD